MEEKQMKTLGGYEIVDEKARQDIDIVAEKADEAYSLAKGATKAFVYDTYSDMVAELNALDKAELLVNFHIMIREVCVPDLWISGISDEHVEYTYTSNEDFIADLTEDGVVQVGYFVLSALETQKVDLTDYVKNTDYAYNKAGVVYVASSGQYGVQTDKTHGILNVCPSTTSEIDLKSNNRKPIVPSNLDYAVMKALSDSKLEWTEEQKKLARALLNAIGSNNVYAENGLAVLGNGNLIISPPIHSLIDDRDKDSIYSQRRAVTLSVLDYAVKKALADCKLTDEDAWTAEEQAAAIERIGLKDYIKYKYFNFIEPGVNVEGNPTYDEIKEAILSDVTPVLIHEHYIAYMTSGHWDAEAFEREELPGFTFVTHRSDMNNQWKIKYTEFWCTKQDDGSTLWAVDEHYYIEDFVAEYGVTTFDEIQNAYNDEKIIVCTDGWLVTKLDIFAPNRYAQFSGLDNLGNPALLQVTKNNNWTRTNVTNATTDFVNQKVGSLETYVNKKIPYLVTYNITSYDEVKSAYDAGNELILYSPSIISNHTGTYANLTSYDGNVFKFVCLDASNIRRCFYVYLNKSNETSWEHNESTLAEYDYAKIIDDNFKNYVNTTNNTLNNHNIKISSLLDSAYKFRGGFCDKAGTLHIKNPGIYLVIAGGTSNKTITINYPTGKEFEATKLSGIILLAYESGAVTPIGIKSSLAFIDAFQMPGTFQGWTSDGRYSTTINYPGGCVVSYLGNSNVNYLA